VLAIVGGFRGGNVGPVILMLDMLLRGATVFVFLLAVIRWRSAADRTKTDLAIAVAAGIIAVAMNNPLSAARFYIFTIYFGAFIVLFRWRRRYSFVFLILLFGALLASSAINFARAAISLPPNLVAISREDGALTLQTIFYSGHFDNYELFVHTLEYVEDKGLVHGRQFLGAVLFWIPRRLWPDKPIGTGAYVAEHYLKAKYRVVYTNLASPPIAEGYINFGVTGVLGVAAVFGLAFGWLDGRRHRYTDGTPRPLDLRVIRYAVFYPVAVAYSLFYLRGDMLSGNAYFAGIAAGYVLAEKLVVRRRPELASNASDTMPAEW
jgi:hypothetical protein